MGNKLAPLHVTDKKGILGEPGTVYDLDFSRESAIYATDHGVDPSNDSPCEQVKNTPLLFYCAFRKDYRRIPREKIDKLRKENGGLHQKHVAYLNGLLVQALTANVIITDSEGDEKNGPAMDVEMETELEETPD